MNRENFKSIVLINLIVISLFLTFNLWTYVPESNSSSDEKYVQGNATTSKKELSSVIIPSSVIVQKNNKTNTHLVVQDEKYVKELYKVLEKGEFHDFREIEKDKDEFLSFVHDEDKLEFVFPTDIPFDAIRSTLTLKEKKLDGYSFNRILIDLSESVDNNIKTYFVSYEDQKIYEMTLKGVTVREITSARDEIRPKAKSYSSYQLDATRKIFLPNDEIEMKESFYYVRNKINEETFKNVLFTDPRYVKEIKGETENTYTDGIRLMKVSKKKQMLQYTNSSIDDDTHMYGSTLVQRSFDFINSHNGLPDNYRFDYMNSKEGKTVFRLYTNSLPTFSKDGMATLEQVWGTAELMSYKRPIFDLLYMDDGEDVILPPGWVVMKSLMENPQVSMRMIQDVGVGYKLTPVSETNGGDIIATVSLKPIWYVVYGEEHQVYEWSEERGGELIGLESN